MSVTTSNSSFTTHARNTGPGVYVYYGHGLIEYEYKPRKGKVERLCGVLGKDKRATIELVRKGIPALADIEPERFDFQIYNPRGCWVRVLDAAWDLLSKDPPLVWIVTIKETPEEKELGETQQRERKRNFSWNTIIVMYVGACVMAFMCWKGGLPLSNIVTVLSTVVVQAIVTVILGGISYM